MKKRILSIVLAMCLLLAVMPTAVLSVTAATPDFTDGTWTALTSGVTEIDGGTDGAKYYLPADVTISSTLAISGGTAAKPVILDLNGHVLKFNGSEGNVVFVPTGANFTLQDSNPTASHKFDTTNTPWVLAADTASGDKIKTVYGGVITGGKLNAAGFVGCGGGVAVMRGTFNMTGGNIVGCSADGGGGVYVENGTFTMSGNSNIIGCKAKTNGGGVYVSGANGSIFTMESGSISACTAGTSGGGVMLETADVGNSNSFNMNGGIIYDCSAPSGGSAVYIDLVRATCSINGVVCGHFNSSMFEGGKSVTFNYNDGTSTVKTGKAYGSKLYAPIPTRDGYRLDGWYTDAACTEANKYDFSSGTVTEGMVLYAKWVHTAHVDEDTNHVCDVTDCGASMGEHKPASATTHICSYCGKPVSTCVDSNKNHECDTCGASMGEHKPASETTHICSYCGKPASACEDSDKNHECDTCAAAMGVHEAAEGKHTCDYCGRLVTWCVDGNKDHKCDVCGRPMGIHLPAYGSHNCAYCGELMTKCIDRNKDHKCDICTAAMGVHEAAEGKHTCDYCGAVVTACADNNKDHKCDLCGKTLSECYGGTATCTNKAKCDLCGKEYGELDASNHSKLDHTNANASTATADGNIEYWHCDSCNKYFSDKDGKTEIKRADTVIKKGTTSSGNVPATGEDSYVALWFALFVVSGGLITVTAACGRKKKHSAE